MQHVYHIAVSGVLAPTHWNLRQAVKMVNQGLTSLRLVKHPDKTFIGRTKRGFDFLGYHVSPDGLRIATKTVANFVARVRQLYEHEPGERVSARLGAYMRRWGRWVTAGVPTGPSRVQLHPPPGTSACLPRSLKQSHVAVLLGFVAHRPRCWGTLLTTLAELLFRVL